MKDISEVRSFFPLLSKKINQKDLIYFDSACMGLRPKQVIDRILYYYTNLSSCGGLGRSSHPLSHEVTKTVVSTRKKVAKWLNASEEEIIFTKNTTEGINTAIMGYRYPRKTNIVITVIDHHSSILPAYQINKKLGIEVKIVNPQANGSYSLDNFTEAINKKTAIVSVSMASNVTGEFAPIKEIISIAHENDALVLVDAAQYAPHKKIDVKKLNIDFLAFSIHKLGGPSGMGIFWGKSDILENLDPLLVGGETVENVMYKDGVLTPKFLPTPAKFEAGLSNYAGIFGTEAIIDFLTVNHQFILTQENKLNKKLVNIFQERKDIHVIGDLNDSDRLPLISFYIDHVSPHDISIFMATELKNYQIMMRAGMHCAAPLHYSLNLDPSKGEGSARVSLAYYNTISELEIFEESLNRFISIVS